MDPPEASDAAPGEMGLKQFGFPFVFLIEISRSDKFFLAQ